MGAGGGEMARLGTRMANAAVGLKVTARRWNRWMRGAPCSPRCLLAHVYARSSGVTCARDLSR